MSDRYNFDEIIPRRDTNCVKWGMAPEEVLPLWVADMDFRSPPEVQAALEEAVRHGVFGYPYFGNEVQRAIVDWLAERHGWEVSPESVVLLEGVVAGFNLAASAFCRPGEGVLIQTPAYGNFLKVAEHFELSEQVHRLVPDEEGSYPLDLEAFEAAIRPETRIFMLCNPHNPTGRVFTRRELEGMAEICLEREILICSDEIHSDLVYSGRQHTPLASLDPEVAANTITLLAPSKTFNIAGLKASAAVIENEDLRKQFNGARRGMLEWVNAMGMTAMLASYRHGGPWLDALLVYLEANRDLLVEFVRTRLPGVHMSVPEATYLAWLDCRGLGLPPAAEDAYFNLFFEEHARVALYEGAWFGHGGEGYARLNFGCPRSILVEALERMETALQAIED